LAESGLITSEFQKMSKRWRARLLVILGILILLAVTLPEKHFFSGMAVGLSIGFYNLGLLQRKVNLQADAAARAGKRIGTGSISRFAAAELGAVIVMRFDWILIVYIIRLMTVYPVIIIGFFSHNRKQN